jgi:enterochelin esterase-like enzyme
MKYKRSLCFALIAGVAALLAACGQGSGLPAIIVQAAGSSPLPTLSALAPTAQTPSPTQAPAATDPAGIAITAGGATGTATLMPSLALTAPLTAPLTAAPSATASRVPCVETQGEFISVSVPSTILPYSIDTRIYLPPCYARSDQAYPVLYLMHGLNFTETQWEMLGAGTTADRLIAAGAIAPLIIVLPRDRGDPRLDPAFVVDLVPYIDGHFRTRPSAAYRAIGGLSHGGGWSIHLGLHYPDVFGRVGAHSPAIFWGDDNNILRYVRAIVKGGSAPAVYIDIGDVDAVPQSAVWLDRILASFNFKHTYLVQSGGHDERYWSAHLGDYLRFYAAGWRPTPPPSATPVPSPTPRHRQ